MTDQELIEGMKVEDTVCCEQLIGRYIPYVMAVILKISSNQLTNEDREIFIRRYFYFEKVIDIAKQLRMKEQTVATKLYRGKEKLQKVGVLRHQQEKVIPLTKSKKGGKRILKRRFLIVAILGILTVTAIGAISVSETLRNFFGEQMNLLIPHTQEIQESITQNGVTMTIDTAIASNSGGIIVVKFEKEDGTLFDVGSEIKDFQVELEATGSYSWGHGWELSEDRKILTYMMHVRCNASAIGSEVKVRAKEIVSITQKEAILPLQLDELVGIDLKGEAKELFTKDRIEPVGLSMQHPHSDAKISNVMLREDILELEIERTYTDKSLQESFKIIDNRTGESMEYISWGETHNTISPVVDAVIEYSPIRKEDLPYLQFITCYNDYDIKVEGTWEASFALQENKHTKASKARHEIPTAEGVFTIEDIEVSILGGRLEGELQFNTIPKEEDGYDFHDNFSVELIMKNGESIPMYTVLTNQSPEENGSILFSVGIAVDDEKWKGYTEEKWEALMQKERKEAKLNRGSIVSITGQSFIDIDQVIGIQIEDTFIKLKK